MSKKIIPIWNLEKELGKQNECVPLNPKDTKMTKSKTIAAIQLLITEAVSKNSWLWRPGQQILLSPLSLKNNIEKGKYLIAFGWTSVTVENVIASIHCRSFNC